MKKKVLVCGCNGAMGRIICESISQTDDMEVHFGFDMIEDFSGPFPIYNDYLVLLNSEETPDIIIDFSAPKATATILQYAWAKKLPIVIATTGLSKADLSDLSAIAHDIPIFQSANMSIQVNLVKHVLETIASAIYAADVEITETHHNRKKDEPSGTAKIFANVVKETLDKVTGKCYDIEYGRTGKRKECSIGVCSKRGGNVVGTHTIEFFSPFETLEITHTAHSRELFADGALKAARFLLNKEPGLYGMDDLV